MFLVKFPNDQFLGVNMNQQLIYALNINFAYTFKSLEHIEKASKFFQLQLNESVFTITDLSGNPLKSINPSII